MICGSLQFQDGVWGANVLTGEQARRLRSSYVNITQAFWDAFQPGTAGDDMARMESERKQLRCRLALLELARSITPDSGCLEPTEFICRCSRWTRLGNIATSSILTSHLLLVGRIIVTALFWIVRGLYCRRQAWNAA